MRLGSKFSFVMSSLVICILLLGFKSDFRGAQDKKDFKKIPFLLSMDTQTATYERLLWQMDIKVDPTDVLDEVLDAGKRMYQWIDHINENRDPDDSISISDPNAIAVYPIAEYKFSNREIVKSKFDAFVQGAPQWFISVVLEASSFTDGLPVDFDEFAKVGRDLDTVYRAASRWLLQEPYLFAYTQRKNEDVRGYYNLTRIENLQTVLSDWSGLTDARKKELKGWLVGLCTNGSSLFGGSCTGQFDRSLNSNDLWSFYQKHLPAGKRKWDGFYGVQGVRRDISWNSSKPNTMSIPFKNPNDAEVEAFLVDNLSDEFQWNGWSMKLDFVSGGNVPYIRFVDGATPNVNGLGGNRITMDSSVPLTDYAVNWTIRHEFGHVLGWKDCYVEFYDADEKHMVYYQIDVDDLMCSRRGKFTQRHFDELKKTYFTGSE